MIWVRALALLTTLVLLAAAGGVGAKDGDFIVLRFTATGRVQDGVWTGQSQMQCHTPMCYEHDVPLAACRGTFDDMRRGRAECEFAVGTTYAHYIDRYNLRCSQWSISAMPDTCVLDYWIAPARSYWLLLFAVVCTAFLCVLALKLRRMWRDAHKSKI